MDSGEVASYTGVIGVNSLDSGLVASYTGVIGVNSLDSGEVASCGKLKSARWVSVKT